jgi:hypothetical protein
MSPSSPSLIKYYFGKLFRNLPIDFSPSLFTLQIAKLPYKDASPRKIRYLA